MKAVKTTLLASSTFFLTSGVAWGHEGHGVPGEGHTVKHYLLEPAHLPTVITCAAVIAVVAFMLGRLTKTGTQRTNLAGLPADQKGE